HSGNGFLAQPRDKVQVDQIVERLKDHAHGNEQRQVQQMFGDRALGKVLHSDPRIGRRELWPVPAWYNDSGRTEAIISSHRKARHSGHALSKDARHSCLRGWKNVNEQLTSETHTLTAK